MHYVTDIVGNEYLSWEKGSRVIITSQTGSGKSTFVLETLLRNAINHDKYVVFFCNRKVLKKQLEDLGSKEIFKILGGESPVDESISSRLIIVSYQFCETSKQFPSFSYFRKNDNTGGINPNQVMYYIFDEAHYFVSDALFNNKTDFWINSIKSASENSTLIFLTATPEPLIMFLNHVDSSDNLTSLSKNILYDYKTYYSVENYIHSHKEPELTCFGFYISDDEKETKKWINDKKIYNNYIARGGPLYELLEFAEKNAFSLRRVGKTKLYTSKTDYSYINAKYFDNFSNLYNEISKSSENWLIFVKSLHDGQNVLTNLNQLNCNAVLLSADTISSAEAALESIMIVNSQKLLHRVVIATSVLDCGVTIRGVQNVIISHTNKTEFLQMLGRIRVTEGETITLYIQSFDVKYISILKSSLQSQILFSCRFANLNADDTKGRLTIKCQAPKCEKL